MAVLISPSEKVTLPLIEKESNETNVTNLDVTFIMFKRRIEIRVQNSLNGTFLSYAGVINIMSTADISVRYYKVHQLVKLSADF